MVALECGVCLIFLLGVPAVGAALWRQAKRQEAYRREMAARDRDLLAHAHRLIAESEALTSGIDDGDDEDHEDEDEP